MSENKCQLPHPRLKANKVTAKEITVLREIIEALDEHGSSDVRAVIKSLDNTSSLEAQIKKIKKDAPDAAPEGLSAVAWSLTDAAKALDLHEDEDDQALFKTCISMLKTAKVVRQLGRGRGQALVLLTDGFVHYESQQRPPYEFCHEIDVQQQTEPTDNAEEEQEDPEPQEEEQEQEFYPDGQPVPPPPGDDDMPPEVVQVAKSEIHSMQKQLEALVQVSSKQTEEYKALQELVREAIRQNAASDVSEEEVSTDDEQVAEETEDDAPLPSIHSF